MFSNAALRVTPQLRIPTTIAAGWKSGWKSGCFHAVCTPDWYASLPQDLPWVQFLCANFVFYSSNVSCLALIPDPWVELKAWHTRFQTACAAGWLLPPWQFEVYAEILIDATPDYNVCNVDDQAIGWYPYHRCIRRSVFLSSLTFRVCISGCTRWVSDEISERVLSNGMLDLF